MNDSRKWLVLAGILLCGWLLYLLAPVLTPFLVAAILAYLCDPLADRLEQRLSRTGAVTVVFVVMIAVLLALLLILVPLLQEQLLGLIRRIPDLIDWVQTRLLPRLSGSLGIELSSVDLDAIRDTLMQNWRDVGNVAGIVVNRITASGVAVFAWLAWLVLIPVVMFYLLRDWDKLMHNLQMLLPRRYEATVVGLVRECDSILAEFLRGQLLVMLSLSLIYSTGLWLAGIEFALLIGMIAGLVSFVPYLGFIIGIGIAGVVAAIQHQDILHPFYVLIIFGIGQMLEGMVLSPLLVGDRIGLHPVAVIFAVLAGGQLFGFVGVLLALPVAAVCVVLLRYAHAQYKTSALYS